MIGPESYASATASSAAASSISRASASIPLTASGSHEIPIASAPA